MGEKTIKLFSLKLMFLILGLSVLQSNLWAQKIYSVDASYQADVKVYVVDAAYKADLLVYKVDASYQAKDNKGQWYFTDAKYKADKAIYFVDAAYKADLNVYFVDAAYKAGWKDKSKQHMMY